MNQPELLVEHSCEQVGWRTQHVSPPPVAVESESESETKGAHHSPQVVLFLTQSRIFFLPSSPTGCTTQYMDSQQATSKLV